MGKPTSGIAWKATTVGGVVYDLSHLHPHRWEVVIPAKDGKPDLILMVNVTYGLHTFARDPLPDEQVSADYWYEDSREKRVFWGSKPEPPKFPSSQFQPRHELIQVDHLAVALEGVMPVQQDVPPGRRRYLGQESVRLGVTAHLVLHQQPREDGRVVEDDRVGDQPGALVADLNFDVGAPGQFLLAADLGDGRA